MPTPVVVLPSAPVLFAIVPPEPALPVPLTFSPPVEPVVSRMIPVFEPPLLEILWNSRLLAPIVVFATFRAVPVVVVSVLTSPPFEPEAPHGFSSQTFNVPPPVAVNAGLPPVLRTRPPLKVIVVPGLVVRTIPEPSPSLPSEIAPEKSFVPPFVPVTATRTPTSSVIVPAYVTFPAPPLTRKSSFVAFVIDPPEAVNVPARFVRLTPRVPLPEELRLVKSIPEALAVTSERTTAAAFVAVTVTLFWTVIPVIAPAWSSVRPVEPDVAMSSELTVTELPPRVTVPVRLGFVVAPVFWIVIPPTVGRAAPWPQSQVVAFIVIAPGVDVGVPPLWTKTTSFEACAVLAEASVLKGLFDRPSPAPAAPLTYQTRLARPIVIVAVALAGVPVPPVSLVAVYVQTSFPVDPTGGV